MAGAARGETGGQRMSLKVSLRHAHPGFALDVRFHTPPGLTVLFGRSGSGKTTIVNAVAGLTRPDFAQIQVNNRVLCDTDQRICLPTHRRRLGYVFQESRLFPHLTVRRNLRYGRFFAPNSAPKADEDRIIDLLGIGGLLDRRPGDLSGGEKQRVALGRALLASPELILADEPLAALDEARKAEILPYFETLRDEAQIPILYVTHSPAEVARLATTVVVLQEGKVLRQGSAAEVLSDPAVTPAGVRGAGAVLEAQVARHHEDGLTELSAGGIAIFLPKIRKATGQKVRIRIAAQDVMLARVPPVGLSALNILPGRIETIRAGDGPGAMVSLNTKAGRVLIRVTGRSLKALDLHTGDTAYAVIKSVSVAPQDVGG
jgi:molybdate transport system ATP-binding protein